jgi:FkbM family methyltransferase
MNTSKLKAALKNLLPYEFRQTLKRKIFVVNDMEARLINIRRAGFKCTGFIDGGANVGDWTKQFWKVFPNVPSIMVEPLPEMIDVLNRLATSVKGSAVEISALGAEPGRVKFRSSETNSAIVCPDENTTDKIIEVNVMTIDNLLQKSTIKPNLIKLDLQGFELEAMKGCQSLEDFFEVIVTEVSVLRIGDVPIFTELDRFLEERNFRLYDVVPQYYRPLDGALWQCDAIYVRKNSPLLKSREWN